MNKVNSFKKELRRHGFYPVRNGNPLAPIFFKHTSEFGGLYAKISNENTLLKVNDLKASYTFNNQKELRKFLKGLEDGFAKYQFSKVLSRNLIKNILEDALTNL
ncbi:MAG: hypothetical protein ACTSR3_19755 [Candidatus Helarchaeota archaeon]